MPGTRRFRIWRHYRRRREKGCGTRRIRFECWLIKHSTMFSTEAWIKLHGAPFAFLYDYLRLSPRAIYISFRLYDGLLNLMRRVAT